MTEQLLVDPESYVATTPAACCATCTTPGHLSGRLKLVSQFELPPSAGVNKVVVLGMGGSAIGADLAHGMHQ
jgi:hypothetical protein